MPSYSIPNFHHDCAEAVNQQIEKSMTVMYFYMAMAAHYQNFSVALPGIYRFGESSATNHLKQAKFYIKYQNKRGKLKAVLPSLSSPSYFFGDALHAMELSQSMELQVYNKLYDLRGIAKTHTDYEMAQMVEEKLSSQLRVIKYIGDFITQLARADTGVGEFYFDYQLEHQVEEDKDRFKNSYENL